MCGDFRSCFRCGSPKDRRSRRASSVDLGFVRFLVPGLLLAVGLWICFRIVNYPKFTDFLISVETEMTKVTWPSRDEVFRSSVVVIFMIFALSAILAAYDLFGGSYYGRFRVLVNRFQVTRFFHTYIQASGHCRE